MEIDYKCYSCSSRNHEEVRPVPAGFTERFWRWFNGQPPEKKAFASGHVFIFDCHKCGRHNCVTYRRKT